MSRLHYHHYAPQSPAMRASVIGGMWAPAALFAGAETGFAWDISATNATYQERTGASATTLASANTDPVGSVRDVSGKGNWFSPSADSKRATLSIAGALKSLSFDATDDEYAGPAGLNGILDDKDFFVGVAASDWQAGVERIVYSSLSTIYIGVPASQGDLMSLRYSTFFNVGSGQSGQTPSANVWTWNCTAGSMVGRRSGVQQGASVAITGGPFSGNQALVGARGSNYSSVKFYRLIVISRSLSAGELASAETWLGSGAGLSI